MYKASRLLFRFRDSCTLLPGSLKSLASTLCPELGTKGEIDHDNITVECLLDRRNELTDYMRQDILLLGGIMIRAQQIYWLKYRIDVEDVMTLSSLAMKIFRLKYLDEKRFHIHIPTKNQDEFVREAYYGGHSDSYKPTGRSLYMYDVNSLYPHVMKSFPMPTCLERQIRASPIR